MRATPGRRSPGSIGRTPGLPVAVVLAVVALAAVTLAGPVRPAAAAGVPYTDPAAVGYLGLCDQAGHQVTSGSIHTTPFAWRAVSSQPAPAPYAVDSRTAILLAYQPQQGLEPGEWSGEGLTASSRYSNPADPMVAATDGDDSLADFLYDFPTRWDGLLQLRIYLGAADQQQYDLHYPTLDIRVTGDTWQAVDGGPVNCDSGTAESLESIVLPSTTTPPSGSTANPATGQHTTGSGPSGTTPAGARSQATAPSSASAAPGAVATTSASVRTPQVVGVVALVAVAAAAGVTLLRRRRRAGDGTSDPGGPPPGSDPESASDPSGQPVPVGAVASGDPSSLPTNGTPAKGTPS